MSGTTDPGPLHVRLGISENAGRVLGAVYVPSSGGGYRSRRVGGYRWLDQVRDQLTLDRDEWRLALGELADLGLIAVSKPSGRGRGQILPIEWRIEEVAR